MMRSFPNIRFGLMVGVGGGAPDMESDDPCNDIRLGDVVVSCPTVNSSGVLQYDFGKTMREGKFIQTGTLNKTSMELRTGISKLRAKHRMEESQMSHHIASMLESNDKMRKDFNRPDQEHDQLFRSDYDHIRGQPSCAICDSNALLIRTPRANEDPIIHYGLIGSANQVMRHGVTREMLRREKGIICFEMEAAGLMDTYPCLAIRGICDYADSHKNKRWQPYAAAAAAAYAKELLSVIPAVEVASTSITNATNMHDMFRFTISELNLYQLLQLLPTLEQKQQSSEVLNLDPDDPQFSWVFRNIDYKSWNSNDSPSALCLSSHEVRQLSQVTSYIVGREEKPNRQVLYFSCPQIANDRFVRSQSVQGEVITITNVLIYTLFEQMIHFSPVEKRKPIVRNFLDGLLKKSFEKKPTQNWIGHDFNKKNRLKVLQSFLINAAAEDLLTLLRMTLDNAKRQHPLVVIEGIGKDYYSDQLLQAIEKFVCDFQRQTPNIKVLLAGPEACSIKGLPPDTLFIEHDKERKECLSSLQFENTRYEKISPEHGGSFEWLWTHNEYRSWSVSETSRLLYIQGKPASGKSTLTKYFGSNFQTRELHAKQAIVAKFFYSFREGETQRSHYNMLLTLLFNILRQDEAFFYHQCQAEYRTHQHNDLRVKWDYASLKRVLKSLQKYSTKNRFYLIIDAIDESDEADRRDILSLLYELCSGMVCCVVKIFIASRPVAQIEARRGQYLNFIRLQDETTADISNFAYSLLDGLHFDATNLLPQAIKYIVDNAFGVFLWVKLAGAELIKAHEDGLSQEAMFTLLKELPTELKDVYERMLDKMKGNDSCLSYGLRMFRFVLLAKRPLTVDELLHSLGIPDNLESNGIFDLSEEALHKRIPSSERIILSSSGFRVVQVIHQTAHEFLLDSHGAVAKTDFRIDKGYAHIVMATVCFRYLTVCAANNFSPGKPPVYKDGIPTKGSYEHYAKCLDRMPLASYAFRYLKDHMDAYWDYDNQDSDTRLRASPIPKNWIDEPFKVLIQKWNGSSMSPEHLKKVRNNLLLAAAAGGFTIAFRTLISAAGEMNLESTDGLGRTALSWASGNGHEAIVRLLLQNNANANAADKFRHDSGRTALSYAAGNGHQAIAELLLQKDASIDTTDHSYGTALSYAAGNGYQAIVELLLQRGASINTADKWRGRTPLLCAARSGHKAIVKLLLQNGALINAIDNSYGTALSYAAGNGYQAIVELLLQNGASVNAADEWEGRTPLAWGARSGNQAAVELLLQCGANLDAEDIDGYTPLSLATINGHQAIVEMLLRQRASYEAWAMMYDTQQQVNSPT
ncbi:putative kinesin [Trichoderma camerunense]